MKLVALARLLLERGHHPIIAVPQINAISGAPELWQAPVWPGQLITTARRARVPPATFGDILAIMGLGDPAAMRGLISAWDSLISASRADVVVTEFAPALQLAARGRLPVVALGTGFSLPPDHTPSLPSLTGQLAVVDEGLLVESINTGLRANGRALIDRLPQMFAADRVLPGTFTELDPYRPFRQGPPCAPSLGSNSVSAGDGEAIFCYLNGWDRDHVWLWDALARCGRRVIVYGPGLGVGDKPEIAARGIDLIDAPMPWAEIAAQSRMVMSHGGLGFVSTALVAGVPQIVIPYDLEKQMTAASIVELGLGERLLGGDQDADAMAARIAAVADDEALRERCVAAAPGFAERVRVDAHVTMADAVGELVG